MDRDITIGHSNGWLCAILGPEYSFTDQAIRYSNAQACELAIDREERLENLLLPGLAPQWDLNFCSLHLPNLSDVDLLPHEERNILGGKFQRLHDAFGFSTGALHPDLASLETNRWLVDLQLPFGIENLDRNKRSFRSLQEMKAALDSWQVPLVLDVQHAFENCVDNGGNGVELSVELALHAYANTGVTHLHVSGEISSEDKTQLDCHASLLWSTNAKAIISAVREIVKLSDEPLKIILEGNYLPPQTPGAPLATLESPDQVPELISIAARNMKRERDILMGELLRS